MRPYIDISHERNGKIKDLANEMDMSVQEVYSEIVERGYNDLAAEHDAEQFDE